MTITVNGQPRTVEQGITLAVFVQRELLSIRGSAAAVDGEFVPRTQWDDFALTSGQSLELVTAVQGG